MTVLHTRHDLLKEMPRLILNKASLFNNVIKQLSCLHKVYPNSPPAAIGVLSGMASRKVKLQQQEYCSHQAGEPSPHGQGRASLSSTLTNSMTT